VRVQVLGVVLLDERWELVVDTGLGQRILLLDALYQFVDIVFESHGRAALWKLEIQDLIQVPVVGKD